MNAPPSTRSKRNKRKRMTDMNSEMSKTSTIFILAACVSLLLGVILGAIGSHALALEPADQSAWEWANQYQLIHSLGLILIAILYDRHKDSLLRWSGVLMLIGVLLFSGSIYASKLGAPASLGAIAPYGGSSFMLGWFLLGVASLRRRGK